MTFGGVVRNEGEWITVAILEQSEMIVPNIEYVQAVNVYLKYIPAFSLLVSCDSDISCEFFCIESLLMDKFIKISLAINNSFHQTFWQLTATFVSGVPTGRMFGAKIQVCDNLCVCDTIDRSTELTPYPQLPRP